MKRAMLIMTSIFILIFLPIGLVWLAIVLGDTSMVKIMSRSQVPEGWNAKKIAASYAPIFLQQTSNSQKHRHWDYLCPIDFDGDWNMKNNAQNLAKAESKELAATVYYSLMETKTHYIIVYSIFHPLEWSYEENQVRKWYENDMKHLQVVVRKKKKSLEGKVSLVTIQRREKPESMSEWQMKFYKTASARFADKRQKFEQQPILLANSQGKEDAKGSHPLVVITSGRHQLFLASKADLGRAVVVYAPSATLKKGQSVPTAAVNVKYALHDTVASLWDRPQKEKDSIYSVFDRYRDMTIDFAKVPRSFEATTQNNKYKFDTNITPFAFGRYFNRKKQKEYPFSFFFNPAAAYSFTFHAKKWSLHYLHYPYSNLPE